MSAQSGRGGDSEPETEARTLAALLDSIVENIPAMIFVKDAKSLRFERFNLAGEEILGLSRDALIGKRDCDAFPAEQAERFQATDREVLRSGAAVDIPEEPIDTPSGRRWLHTRKTWIADTAGTPRYLLGVSMDVTERKRAAEFLLRTRDELELRVHQRTAELSEANAALKALIAERQTTQDTLRKAQEQLRQAQKIGALGRLAGGVAHDFNNLLSVVLSYTELILADLRPDDPLRAEIKEINTAGRRAADLTRQLLAFSRQQVLQPKVIDLNQILAGLERMVHRLLGADIELATLPSSAIGRIQADPGQVEQIVINLVANARDAMPRGGRLAIETADVELDDAYARDHDDVTPGRYVRLTVCDTGMGMEKATQGQSLEPFFTTKDKEEGTGLGLASVFAIVQESGGHVSVCSEPGKGTTIRVYFPRVEGSAETLASLPPNAIPGTRSETILLVEDEEQVLGVARGILRRCGYHVLEARNAGEALLISEKHTQEIHLLLTDVVLPHMSGHELAERIQSQRPDAKILFMSGYTDEAIVQRGVLHSDLGFLQKPITPESLSRKVRDVLGSSRTIESERY